MNSETSESIPVTEQENPETRNLSFQCSLEIVRLMNEQDSLVAPAVALALPEIGRAIDGIVERLKNGGRLFYIGTGTSGRLGVLDASECPPTFGVSPELVQAVIAGGYEACHRAVEASEDDRNAGGDDLKARGFTSKDVLVGIAASGRTPYTIGAVDYARTLGALTVALTCVPNSLITNAAEISIVPVVGPEVVAGSTRLKAGTAQKMVLNMLSTASLAKLGYVTGNRMTSVQARNTKLRARALRILSAETGLNLDSATAALDAAEGDIRVALVMSKTRRSAAEAKAALAAAKGVVQTAIDELGNSGTGN
ncbi:MAG TPA: N-acetylmuramic acid 6-phosphate etherase [Pyrinomonadaceae bacterium]|nr:N-acetylmuramic acid 6-phosphate etherase [Pyrinomonadaceae bacterium]